MKINALRRELTEMLNGTAVRRQPALRRSLDENWLYATDLPSVCTGEALQDTLLRLSEKGWESVIDGGWLQLRKDCQDPPEDWFEGPFGTEAGCCLSILDRHPGRRTGPSGQITCRLIKAGEEGAGTYEQACRELHRILSGRLRGKKELPDISPRYLGGP